MRWKWHSLALFVVALSSPSLGQVSLNTGYNHTNFTVYPAPTGTLSTPADRDNFWIKIASYEPPAGTVAVAPAWVLNPSPAPWVAPFPNSRWIGPLNSVFSAGAGGTGGTNPVRPAYSIFRKCFCLATLQANQSPTLSFQIRADDYVHVWLNSHLNTLVGPVMGNSSGGLLPSGSTSNPAMFRAGRNCLYVLVEDYFGGHMGFNLTGSVTGPGVLPWAAAGVESIFQPCGCPTPGPATGGASSALSERIDDREMIAAIHAIARSRRGSAQRYAPSIPAPQAGFSGRASGGN